MKRVVVNACQRVEKLLKLNKDDGGGYGRKPLDFNLGYCRKWER